MQLYSLIRSSVHQQHDWRYITTACVVAATVVGISLLVPVIFGVDYGDLIRDPASIGVLGDELHWYSGWLSHVSVSIWAIGAVSCLITAIVRWNNKDSRFSYMLWSGILSAYLYADDLFMFHDGLFLQFGIGEKKTMALLGLVAMFWAFRFRGQLLASPIAPLLLIAATAFAASIAIDAVENIVALWTWEESAKLAGASCWSAFLVYESVKTLRSPGSAKEAPPAKTTVERTGS
jgi:hypothetical protein